MKSSYKKNKYIVIQNALSPELCDFVYKYFLLKRSVFNTFRTDRYISPLTTYYGTTQDPQVINTYSHYGDIAMETLLVKLMPLVSKITKTKLNPNYAYARIYKKGDVLKRHKDRFSCEISTTLNLGGDKWPIYLNPDVKEGYVTGPKMGIHQVQHYVPSTSKGIKVDLKVGDMLVYSGCDLEHWREEFTGENCGQVFLHYNNLATPGAKENIFDSRPHLGLPADYKQKK
tara:strand:- start:359 stop:1045 length:687 start_codon:yes stop_codon:yes gene_type:complete